MFVILIINIVATRCHIIFKAEVLQIRFRLGLLLCGGREEEMERIEKEERGKGREGMERRERRKTSR